MNVKEQIETEAVERVAEEAAAVERDGYDGIHEEL